MSALLGLDIGTTSTIGILIDNEGGILATASRPSALVSRHANWAEEDTELWWTNVRELVPDLGEFIRTVADISSYEEFLKILDEMEGRG